MAGYVVSKGGTFGTVKRTYRNDAGVPHVVVRHGPLGWLTPVPESEIMQLSSRYESEALLEAKQLLDGLIEPLKNAPL